jgi:hypothetical protein
MLPKAVEEQMRRAEDLHRQAYGNTEQPTAPAPEEDQKADVPVLNEVVAPEQPKPKDQVDPGEEATFKRRYEVLHGKYSAEVPRMAAEIRDLKAKLAQAEAAAEAAKTATPAPSRLKPEEVEEYGAGFVDFVKRAASEVVPEDVGQIKESVQQLRNETERLAKARFLNDLTQAAPRWEQLNEDKGFLTWLSGIDPLSGRVRQEIFDEAAGRFDAWRTANFFNSYVSDNSAEPEAPPVQHVEPPTTRVSAPPPGKRTWTNREIAAFYAAVREGRYTKEQTDGIEKDIFAAQREGRIVNR